MQIWQTIFDSPLGPLRALCSLNGLCWLAFQEGKENLHILPSRLIPYFPKAQLENKPHPFFTVTEHWLTAYFSNSLLPNVPRLDLQGTDFSKKLWIYLQSLPLGEIQSYGWLAAKLNNPKAVRAAGRSLRENPIALMVPCHRIIGANGSLTGYRGELWRKEWLLNHEKVSGYKPLPTHRSYSKQETSSHPCL